MKFTIQNIKNRFSKLNKNTYPSNKITICIIVILTIWFIYQSLFFLTNLSQGFIPDEEYHTRYINIYRNRDSLSPIIGEWKEDNRPQDIRTPSYLYHYILGNISRLFPGEALNYDALKCINAVFNIVTVFMFIKLLYTLTKNNWIKILSMIFMTNTLMFTTLGVGVNYDNLVNLFSIISIYFVIKIIKYEDYKYFFILIPTGIAALLTKFTFLPLFFLEIIVSSFKIKGIYKYSKEFIINHKKIFNIKTLLLIIITFTMICLFAERYGYNLIKYRKISPSCDQLYSVEKCTTDPQYDRDKNLIETAHERKRINLYLFTTNWINSMIDGTYGLLGHRSFAINLKLFYVVTFCTFILFFGISRYESLKSEKTHLALIFIGLGFGFILLFFVNYLRYRKLNQYGVAIQGRYIFPVLSIIHYLFSYYLIRITKRSNLLKLCLSFFLLFMFIYGGFYWFSRYSDSSWYINEKPNFILISES